MDADFSDSGINGPDGTPATDSIVLEEEIDPNYVPSDEEVVEYAKWLGMDLEKDKDLYWVAREGLMAPLPKNWKPCKTKDTEDIYYFNFSSGESTWDHPCDGYYKSLYEEEKKKKEISMKERNDQQRSKAKQDVEELLGKGEKKKKKGTSSLCDLSSSSMKLPSGPLGLASLERKPLPGIMLQGVLGSLQGLSKSWTGANAKDGDKEKERRKKEKDKEIQNSSSEKDRNIGSYRSDSTPSSGAADNGDGKTRRRQRDSSSPVTVMGREPIAISTATHSKDANRRSSVTSHLDRSRRDSISDKGRMGEEGPYKDGEFVMYSSGSDSGSEGPGSPSKPSNAAKSRNALPAATKAAPMSSRRLSIDSTTNIHMEKDKDKSLRSDRGKERELEKDKEKEKELESNADGLERDGKGWVPRDQEAVRSKASSSSSSSVNASSSSRADNQRQDSRGQDSQREDSQREDRQKQGRSEKDKYDATSNDDVRNFSDDDLSVKAYSHDRRDSSSKSDKESQRQKDRGVDTREDEGTRGMEKERDREKGRHNEGERGGEGKDDRGQILRGFDHTTNPTRRERDKSDTTSPHRGSGTGAGTGGGGTGSISTFSDVGGINLSGGSAGSGLSHSAAASQRDHLDDMSARRKSWQKEVDTHEASLGLQRAVMIKEKRKLDDEQDLLRKKQSTEDSGDYGGAGYNISVISPMNAVADLRSKLRELESEMDEMRIQSKSAEQDIRDLQRSLDREKEVAIRILTESEAKEEKLTKQLKSARALTNTLEGERRQLQSDLATMRSELKRKTIDKIPEAGHGDGKNDDTDSTVLLGKISSLERSLEQETHSKAALSQLMEAAQSAHEKQSAALRKQLDHTKYNLEALRTFSDKAAVSDGNKPKNDAQNKTEIEELSSIIKAKTEEIEILSSKSEKAESDVEALRGSFSALTALSDLRVRQLEEEKQTLTMHLVAESLKVSSMAEQVMVLEGKVADKELQYQKAKQAATALQRMSDQANTKAPTTAPAQAKAQTQADRGILRGESEDADGGEDGYGDLHTLRKQASLDETHRAHEKEIRILTNQILVAQDARTAAESLLRSSESSGNNTEHSDLLVKFNALSSELNSEKFSGAAKDVKISTLQDEKEKLKNITGNIGSLQEKIIKMEQEIVKSHSQLLTKETELLYLNGQIENSDTSSKKTISELHQLNSSLSERMTQAAATVRDLSNQLKTSTEEKSKIEKHYDEKTKICEKLKNELNAERKKSPKVNQLEVERDTLLKTVSLSGNTIRDLEKRISSMTAEMDIMKSALLGTERGPAAIEAKDKQIALLIKTDQLGVKNAELIASHAALLGNERNQHQKVLSSLHEMLKGKEKEITTLKANNVEHDRRKITSVASPSAPPVPPPPPPPLSQPLPPPPPLLPSEGSAGIAALSLIVGQQQTSVQRLTEKLESAEGLIFALTQALPGSRLAQEPDSFRSPVRGSAATSSVIMNSHRKEGGAKAEADADSDVDSGSAGESERKADHYKTNNMHSPTFTSPGNDKRKGQRERERSSKIDSENEKEGEAELEKDLILTPDQTSMSENESKLKEAARQWRTNINPSIAESWSKVPSRNDPQVVTKSPMRTRPQRIKEKEKEREREKEREKEKDRPGSELGLEMWALKVARENRFLEDLTATLKEEKLSVRREQESLGKRRAKWRVKKASNPGDILGKMELREESAELNTHTSRLNAAVEQTRVMQGFLTDRRRKLDALKDSLQQLSECRDAFGVPTRVKGSTAHPHTDDADLTLEAMHRLGRELDSEVEVTLHQFGCPSSADEASDRVWGRSAHSNHDGKAVSQDRSYQRSAQNQSAKTRTKPHSQQQHSSGHPQQAQGMRGFYSPQGSAPFDPRMYPFGYEQGTHYQMQTGPAYSNPDSGYVQQQQDMSRDRNQEGYYIPPPTSSSPPRTHEDPGRWSVPPSTTRFNMGGQALPGDFSSSFMYTYPYTDLRHSAPHTERVPVRDPRAIREQLKDLTKRRAQSTEAYDTHASWLNNLQAEIGQFSHATGVRGRAAVRGGESIPSFSAFMASQGTPLSTGEKYLTTTAAELENEAKKL